RGGGRALLVVAAHVEVVVVGAPVGQAVNERRVAVVGEHDRPVGREQGVELVVGQAVGVFGVGLQAHEVDHVDDPHLEVGKAAAEYVGGRQRLEGGHIACACEHDVGPPIVVVR